MSSGLKYQQTLAFPEPPLLLALTRVFQPLYDGRYGPDDSLFWGPSCALWDLE